MPEYDRATLKQYLLGHLDEATREEIRERALRDPDLFEQLREIEDDLLDEFVRGDASQEQLNEWNRFLVDSSQLHRVEAASALAVNHTSNRQKRQPAWWRWAAAAIFAVLSFWLWNREQARDHAMVATNAETWRLTSATARGPEDAVRFKAINSLVHIELAVAFPAGTQQWSAEIRNAARQLIHGESGTVSVPAGAESYPLTIHASGDKLSPGFYTLEVRSGGMLAGAWRFEIVK